MTNASVMGKALREARRANPEASDDEIAELAADILAEWQQEASEDREMFGGPQPRRSTASAADNRSTEQQWPTTLTRSWRTSCTAS